MILPYRSTLVSADGVEILMANCICATCKRYMDCTGEELCELCEISYEHAEERNKQEMKRMTDAPHIIENEVWDTQP